MSVHYSILSRNEVSGKPGAVHPASFSVDPDIIIMGDFNRFGDQQESVKHLEYQDFVAPNVTIFDPNFNELKKVTRQSIKGKGIPGDNPQLISTTVAKNTNVYDMFLMTEDVKEELPPNPEYGKDWGIIHFDEKDGVGHQTGADELKHNALKEAYSDHRPLWFRYKINSADTQDDDGSGQMTQTAQLGVYVATEFGKKFHYPHCHTIKNRAAPITFSSVQDALKNYSACMVCKPE